MTLDLRERLAHVAGLRPARAAAPAARRDLPAAARRLLSFPGAAVGTNAGGEHLVVRRSFPDCRAPAEAAGALPLLAPDAPAAACDPRRWLLLDTETTGLAGGTGTYPFLVGLAWWGEGGLEIEQLFMRDYCEERSVLDEVGRHLAARPVLLTFNGKCFDWPLLETRFRMARAAAREAPEAHLDLLHPARRLWHARLGTARLSVLERTVLGLDRGRDLPSELIPARYFSYLRGGPAEPLAEVFRHNQLDLRGLAQLALRLVELLAVPERAAGDGLELYGLARMLDGRGARPAARRLYELALEAGLPEAAEQGARASLAQLAKRDRDYARATRLWRELAEPSAPGLVAYEELAMYLEHRARDFTRAREVARAACAALARAAELGRIAPPLRGRIEARLEHRLARLERKAASGAPWSVPE